MNEPVLELRWKTDRVYRWREYKRVFNYMYSYCETKKLYLYLLRSIRNEFLYILKFILRKR